MTDYKLLCRQLELFAEEDPWYLPLLSNASALLWEALTDINWAGFYVVKKAADASKDMLVLGPFQGKPACIHIEYGKGVCGTAWEQDLTQREKVIREKEKKLGIDSSEGYYGGANND